MYRLKSGRDAGKWVAQVDLGWTPEGKRNRPRRVRATKREADAEMKKLLELRDTGVRNIENVHRWLDYWLEEVIAPHRAPNTYRAYSNAIAAIRPGIPKTVTLVAFDARHVRQAQAVMRAAGKSPARIREATSILSFAFGQAVRDRMLPRSPVAPVLAAMPKHESTPRAELTWAETVDALDATTDPQHRAWFAASFMTGLRPAETLGLRRDDLDLERDDTGIWHGVLHVRRQLGTRGDEAGTRVKTKTRRSVRDVPLEPLAASILAAWVDAAPESPWLFPGRKPSQPTSYRSYLAGWKTALAAAGARPISPHGARATFATRLLDRGVSPAVAAKILGDLPETLMRHYARSTAATEREAMRALEG